MEEHRRVEEQDYPFRPSYQPASDAARQTLGDLTVAVSAAVAPRIGDTLTLNVGIDDVYLFDGAGVRINLPKVGTTPEISLRSAPEILPATPPEITAEVMPDLTAGLAAELAAELASQSAPEELPKAG